MADQPARDPRPVFEPPPGLAEAVDGYAEGLFRAVVRLLAGQRPDQSHDIASDVVERFLPRALDIMTHYPEPGRYARVAASHAGISYDRRERAQRGEGVRLVEQRDGQRVPARRYLSGHVPLGDHGGELFDAVADEHEPAAEAVEHRDLLERCLASLTPADRRLLVLVDGFGYSVCDVAGQMGQCRETVSRRISRIRREARRHAALLAG